MKFKSKKTYDLNKYLLPAILIGAMVVVSFIFTIPELEKISQKRQLIPTKQAKLEGLQKKRQLLESISSEDTLNLYRIAETTLPQDKDAAGILFSLENISSQTKQGVDAIELSPGLVSTESGKAATESAQFVSNDSLLYKGTPAMVVEVLTRGETNQFIDFMKLIQGSRRVFDISSIQLSYLADASDFLTAEFLLRAYFLPPITEIGSVESVLPEITSQEKQVVRSLEALPYMSAASEDLTILEESIGKTDLFSL